MKKLLAIVAMTMTLTTCGVAANAVTEAGPVTTESDHKNFIEFLIETKQAQTLLEQQHAEFQAAQLRAETMQSRIQSLEKHVGNTWYVFSGITPDGWDCSGLVMWFYSKFEVELQHSVTAQMHSGQIVDEPMPGDVIAFRYLGSERGYHNGIFIGNDKFIHSPKPGRATEVSSVSRYIGDHSEAVYTRINVGVLE